MKKILTSLPTFLIFLCCFLFSIAGSLVSLHRYWQYEVFYYDFGIFDQAIWKVAHFQAPTIEHLVAEGKWIFADHFNPSIFFLSPLYWITTRSEVLLLAQAIIVGISGYVLYLIGNEIVKNKWVSLSIVIIYFLFIGLQNAVITDFHEVTIATLPFMILFWAIVKKKWVWMYVSLIIFLGCKESNFLVGIGIAVAMVLLNRKNWKHSLAIIGISSLWGVIAMKVVIPYFLGSTYSYAVPLSYAPAEIQHAFLSSPIKINTMVFSLLSFGMLPLLSPAFWPLILEDFLSRFYLDIWATRWTLGLHYNALLAGILAISSLYSLRFLFRFSLINKLRYVIVGLLIINAVILYRFMLHGPFGLAYNAAFYQNTKNFTFLNVLVSKIPPTASVMTQNNLAVRFDHQQVWLLKENYYQYKPAYIVFDLRPGQNPNDFFGVKYNRQYAVFAAVKKDPAYQMVYSTDYQYIFKRISPAK